MSGQSEDRLGPLHRVLERDVSVRAVEGLGRGEGDVDAVEPGSLQALPAALVQHEPDDLRPGPALDPGHDLLRARHLRHALVAHEAHRLDARQPGGREPAHELGTDRRGERLRLVLEPVPRPDVAEGYPHGQSVVAPDVAPWTATVR